MPELVTKIILFSEPLFWAMLGCLKTCSTLLRGKNSAKTCLQSNYLKYEKRRILPKILRKLNFTLFIRNNFWKNFLKARFCRLRKVAPYSATPKQTAQNRAEWFKTALVSVFPPAAPSYTIQHHTKTNCAKQSRMVQNCACQY